MHQTSTKPHFLSFSPSIMIKHLLNLFVLLVFMAAKSNAQTTTFEPTNKHEIMLGYTNVFSLKTPSNFGFGYRYNFKRFSIRSMFDGSTTQNYNYSNQSNSTSDFTVKLGYMFVRPFGRNQVYFGQDFFYSYNESLFSLITTTTGQGKTTSTSRFQENVLGVSGFIGYRFYINQWLSITTESGLNFRYGGSKTTNKVYFEKTPSLNTESTSRQEYWGLSTIPFGLLSVNIHF